MQGLKCDVHFEEETAKQNNERVDIKRTIESFTKHLKFCFFQFFVVVFSPTVI